VARSICFVSAQKKRQESVMARKPKGPRLYLRNDAGGKRWIIRDTTGDTRTGFGEEQAAEAQAMFDH
jgi:hypothetical protein